MKSARPSSTKPRVIAQISFAVFCGPVGTTRIPTNRQKRDVWCCRCRCRPRGARRLSPICWCCRTRRDGAPARWTPCGRGTHSARSRSPRCWNARSTTGRGHRFNSSDRVGRKTPGCRPFLGVLHHRGADPAGHEQHRGNGLLGVITSDTPSFDGVRPDAVGCACRGKAARRRGGPGWTAKRILRRREIQEPLYLSSTVAFRTAPAHGGWRRVRAMG
jgi:hypothetical protein